MKKVVQELLKIAKEINAGFPMVREFYPTQDGKSFNLVWKAYLGDTFSVIMIPFIKKFNGLVDLDVRKIGKSEISSLEIKPDGKRIKFITIGNVFYRGLTLEEGKDRLQRIGFAEIKG